MARLFDISELEQDIFSENELLAIDDYAHEANVEENPLLESKGTNAEQPEEENVPQEDFPALELELSMEDGQSLVCEVVGVFLEGEKEYMALHPKEDTEGVIHLMILEQGEDDEIQLFPIEDEEEMNQAALAFHRYMDDSPLEFEEELSEDEFENEVLAEEELSEMDAEMGKQESNE